MPKLLIPAFLMVALFATCSKKEVPPPVAILPVPSEAQLAWHEMETNAFIHFSINTFTDKEWGYGDEKPSLFNPSEVDTDQWIRTLKEAGFKTIILTCKHHDGFCLWPSEFTEHSIKNSLYKGGKGNIVEEVAESVKRYGLKFGIYVSPWDRNRGDYGKPEYIDYYRKQLSELFMDYGPITEMWFDGANGGDGYYGGANTKRAIDGATYYDWPATLEHVRTLEPNVLFFSDAGPGVRWVGNEEGIAGQTNWCTITPDSLYAGKHGMAKLLNSGDENGTHWIPAEVDVSIRPGWFYHAKEDSVVKTPEKLFDIYLSSVGRGSTLLLNVPPDKRGLIHENDIKALRGWREMLDTEFKTNLASLALVTSDSYRGTDNAYCPNNVTDGNKETYWATDDDLSTGTLEISLGDASTIKYIVLQEYIKLGQRIKAFHVDVWKDNTWQKVAEGTTIGHKRILKVAPVRTDKFRIVISASKACPVISTVEAY